MPISKWNGPAIKARIEGEMKRRIAACCVLGVNEAKRLLNVEGTAKRTTSIVVAGVRKRKGSLIYGARRSKPGQPPFKQTGRLQSSVTWDINGLVGRYGTNVIYGRVLELRLNRVWLRLSFLNLQSKFRNLLTAPIGSFTNPIDVTFR